MGIFAHRQHIFLTSVACHHHRYLDFLPPIGHGGDGFLKFADKEEVTSQDLAAALSSAKAMGRFDEVGRHLLVVVGCCTRPV